jgi:hypothetical protein
MVFAISSIIPVSAAGLLNEKEVMVFSPPIDVGLELHEILKNAAVQIKRTTKRFLIITLPPLLKNIWISSR